MYMFLFVFLTFFFGKIGGYGCLFIIGGKYMYIEEITHFTFDIRVLITLKYRIKIYYICILAGGTLYNKIAG